MPTPSGRPNKRLSQTVMDMVRSLAVVLAVVVVIGLLVWRPTTASVRVVDVEGLHAMAVRQADFPLALPGDATGLEATSVRWEATPQSGGVPVWHVGYVADGTEYLQLSQSRQDSAAFIAEQAAGGEPVGVADIGGVPWQRLESPDRRTLVRVADGVTTIVSGTGSWESLERAAAGLSTTTSNDQ